MEFYRYANCQTLLLKNNFFNFINTNFVDTLLQFSAYGLEANFTFGKLMDISNVQLDKLDSLFTAVLQLVEIPRLIVIPDLAIQKLTRGRG